MRTAVSLLLVLAALSGCSTATRPCDQPLLTTGIGAYDIDITGSGEGVRPTASIEYRMSPVVWRVRPTVGGVAMGMGCYYAYTGVLFDIPLSRRLYLCPSSPIGYLENGSGKNLGHEIQMRSGLEIAYVLDDGQRFGLHLNHISNAGLGWSNRGAEALLFTYSVPVPALARSMRSVQ